MSLGLACLQVRACAAPSACALQFACPCPSALHPDLVPSRVPHHPAGLSPEQPCPPRPACLPPAAAGWMGACRSHCHPTSMRTTAWRLEGCPWGNAPAEVPRAPGTCTGAGARQLAITPATSQAHKAQLLLCGRRCHLSAFVPCRLLLSCTVVGFGGRPCCRCSQPPF